MTRFAIDEPDPAPYDDSPETLEDDYQARRRAELDGMRPASGDTAMTRYVIVRSDTGQYWTGTWDGWSAFEGEARTFPFLSDALIAAYQECGLDCARYEARPVAIAREAVCA